MGVRSGRALLRAKVGSLGTIQKLADVVQKGRLKLALGFRKSLRKDWLVGGTRDQVWEARGPGELRSCERCLPG